uniref:Tryptophanyl-tRNA synthetase n=1 Tax=Glossina palpalis gambiensis TaxID=67801 RepID=A0A1B0ALH1_9MUSC
MYENIQFGIVLFIYWFMTAQAAPAISSTFPFLFGNKKVHCLVPCAIDQDPYFRRTGHISPRLGYPKGALIILVFSRLYKVPTQKCPQNSAIFLIDASEQIKNKINNYAFSGGRDTIEEHRAMGGVPRRGSNSL